MNIDHNLANSSKHNYMIQNRCCLIFHQITISIRHTCRLCFRIRIIIMLILLVSFSSVQQSSLLSLNHILILSIWHRRILEMSLLIITWICLIYNTFCLKPLWTKFQLIIFRYFYRLHSFLPENDITQFLCRFDEPSWHHYLHRG